jgi:hypothetical protein
MATMAGLLEALFDANGMGHFIQTPEDSKKPVPKLGIQDPPKRPKWDRPRARGRAA